MARYIETPGEEQSGCGCCCSVLLLAAILMVIWNTVLVHILPFRRIGLIEAALIIVLIGVFGAAQRLFRR